ncbi:hypothetical protein MMPV_005704 [Pyropia vietnamensis]
MAAAPIISDGLHLLWDLDEEYVPTLLSLQSDGLMDYSRRGCYHPSSDAELAVASEISMDAPQPCCTVAALGDPLLLEDPDALGGFPFSMGEASLPLDSWIANQVSERVSSDCVDCGDIPTVAGLGYPSSEPLTLHGEQPCDAADGMESTLCSWAVDDGELFASSSSTGETSSVRLDGIVDVGGVTVANGVPTCGPTATRGAFAAATEMERAAPAAAEMTAVETAAEEVASAAIRAILDDPTGEEATVFAESHAGQSIGGDPIGGAERGLFWDSDDGAPSAVVDATAFATSTCVAAARAAAVTVLDAANGAAGAVAVAAGKSVATKTVSSRRRRTARISWLLEAYLVASLPNSAARRLLPSRADKMALAKRLHVNHKVVTYWFANARRPERFDKLRVKLLRGGVTLVKKPLARGRPKKPRKRRPRRW